MSLNQAYNDFLFGMEPVFRDNQDRWFRSLPFGMQQKAIAKALRGIPSGDSPAEILYVALGLSHGFAEELVRRELRCEASSCPPPCL